MKDLSLSYKPLSAATWKLFEKLLGPRGACGGCWCMTWRLQKAEFELLKGDGTKKMMHDLIAADEPAGIIAFHNNEPIGWCAVAPREKYKRLEKSRALKPVDLNPVWCISCLFISKPYRKQGVSTMLILEAAAYAKQMGAEIVEAYPIENNKKSLPDVFAWTGVLSAFKKAGFKEVKRNTPARPIVRMLL